MKAGQPTSIKPIQLLLRLPVPWIFVLAYLIGVLLEYIFPFRADQDAARSITNVAGITLFAVGAVIAGWAWTIFRRAGTTRVPGEVSATFVFWGPYRATRNPMYVGLALAYAGEALMLRQIWPILVLPFMLVYLNWIVIPLEETRLREVFQGRYDEYCTRVRRWF
jgi:protein-S-isoprenylcysteine O-methyltransferase Ste14